MADTQHVLLFVITLHHGKSLHKNKEPEAWENPERVKHSKTSVKQWKGHNSIKRLNFLQKHVVVFLDVLASQNINILDSF